MRLYALFEAMMNAMMVQQQTLNILCQQCQNDVWHQWWEEDSKFARTLWEETTLLAWKREVKMW